MTQNEIENVWLKKRTRMKRIYERSGSLGLNQWMNENDVGYMSLEDIGYVLGVTRERVRQIELSALQKLRHPKIGMKLKTYVKELNSDLYYEPIII